MKEIKVGKSENFSEWYNQVVLKSGLADYGPIQGTMAIRPLGYSIWENIQKIFDEKIKRKGHFNCYFPLLIPENLLKKEAEHFEGFVPEVFWVSESGEKKLSEKLAVRPTSETIVYYFMSKWIRSWRDLPLKLNQWCNVLRAEIKSTKLFLRTTEFLWQEGHTAHETKKEAEREVIEILKEYRDLIENYLAIPVIEGRKSETEKFAGALETYTLESLMPDGKALQMCTSHNLGQNFSKPFQIGFLNRKGKFEYVWTTSWGITTRIIGALVMVHGDDKGLILPPKISPIKAVIIPIYYSERERKRVFKKCEEIEEKVGVECYFDSRTEYTPGWKFNEWELKGIPLRIEIGPKEIKSKKVVLSRRDTGERILVKEKSLRKKVAEILDKIQENLFKRAKDFLRKNTFTAKSFEEFKKFVLKGGFIRAGWCGSKECEKKIKEETTATIRVIPYKKMGFNCVYCGRKGFIVYFAKSY